MSRSKLSGLSQMIQDGGRLAQEKHQKARLIEQLKQTVEQLEQARSVRGMVLPERVKSLRQPKTFARLICGDLHGSHGEPAAVAALLSDIADIDIREIVLLGDMVECGGWLMLSHTLGYVAQLDEVNYEEDVACANDFLDKLSALCPKASIHYVEGNHELRVERWCVDACQGNKSNAEFLMRAVAPVNVLSLAKRGIPYYRQSEQYGCSTRGTVKLGKSYFTHGFTTTRHAAATTVGRYAGCVFFGHTHRADTATTQLVNVGLVSAWNPGCLCQLSPRWKHTDPSTWTQGYILQIVNSEDETFQAIPVPIHNGKSYLTTLLKTIR